MFIFRSTVNPDEPDISVEGSAAPFSHRRTAEGATEATVSTANGLEVSFDHRRSTFEVRLPSFAYGGKMEGMCGEWGGFQFQIKH